MLRPELAGHLRHNGLFLGENVRAAVAEGRADYTPGVARRDRAPLRDELRIDVALVQTSPPDEHGFLSLGLGPDCTLTAAGRGVAGHRRDERSDAPCAG